MVVEDAWHRFTGFCGIAAAALIGKAAKVRPGGKAFLLVGILAFVISILVIFFLAQTPALL